MENINASGLADFSEGQIKIVAANKIGRKTMADNNMTTSLK
jgi:hypothetical protein